MGNRWILAACCALLSFASLQAEDVTMKITKRYLNLPVSHQVERGRMSLQTKGKANQAFVIRLAKGQPDYWTFCDLSAYQGKTITISYPGEQTGLKQVYQSDEAVAKKELYREKNRPQLHFTAQVGWINDPNGLIYHEGEYHLFFQHNPYERDWENMHWGHAVSKDLIHWEQLSEALYPDEHGTIFSGSAVIDEANTAGYNKGETPAMIALYTAASPEKQVQCMAYSLDKGRTWTKYEKNPVIDSKAIWNSQDTRDPKVFWYAPANHWVQVLNERDGHSIYTSTNLKEWTFESHVTGFWECPELFELPIDGDKTRTKWVMYGASGTYMLGSFDGRKFTPEAGKYYYGTGAIYAAQTFSNIPTCDGRRIQIGWGRISHPEMPFNGMMMLPTELSLRTTKNGVRLFSVPVKEFEKLQTKVGQWKSLSAEEANRFMKPYKNAGTLRVRTTIKLSHATQAGFNLFGQELMKYDLVSCLVNGVFYSPDEMTSMEITADVIVDQTSVEVFIDGGAYSYSMERRAHSGNEEGFHFWGNNIEVKELEVYSLQSIWP